MQGGAEDFEDLIELMAALDPGKGGSLPARALWRVRDFLGRWFDLGRTSRNGSGEEGHEARLPIPGTNDVSLSARLPTDLRNSAAELRFGPFTSLYRTDTEFAAEVSNRTVHAVLHLAWVEHGIGNHRGQMAVYVKPRGVFGRGYMAFIKPFRYWVVYPSLMRLIQRMWDARVQQA